MTPQERHNAIFNVTGETLWGFQVAMVMPATVLTVLLTQLGASKATIGLIPSFEGLAMFLSVAGVYLFRSHKKRKLQLILFHYLVLTPCLATMGLAVLAHHILSREALEILLVVCWAVFMGGAGVLGPIWMDWVAHLFRQEIRGTVTGISWGFSSMAGVAGALVSGWALGGSQEITTYGWLYLCAALFATLSITVFFAIRDPATDLAVDHAPTVLEILAAAGESLSDARFRAILIGRCLGLAGFCIGPFIALHYLSPSGGSLADSLVVSLGAAQTAGAAICCVVFGRIGDRIGHRFGMVSGIVFQICSLLCALLIPGTAGCFLAMLFSGFVGGTLLISYLNLVIESCPHQVRAAHLLIGNMVVGVAGFLFPLAGARIAIVAGIPALMEVSIVVSVVALVWSVMRMKDPRGAKAPTEIRVWTGV
jgi:MFS family permease